MLLLFAENPPANVWTALPSLLWIGLAAIVLLALWDQLQSLIQNLSWRLRTGAAVKLFSLELGQSYVAQNMDQVQRDTAVKHYSDDGRRWNQREQYYQPNRNIHIVHRIAPSGRPGMLYDIQIYLVPHNGATLVNVSRVEYYFGRHWGNQVFVCADRARSFAISTSAFGAFMCTAELFFTDGAQMIINRYIDFEMGSIGKPTSEGSSLDGHAEKT